MAIQTLGLGSVADDGTGDTLRIAGDKINDNFSDIYTVLGDGTTLSTPAATASPTFTGVISFPDGSASAPSITNTGDTNSGLFFSAADTLSFTSGGTSQFTMADGAISPVTDSDVDLGTSSLRFKDLHIDKVKVEDGGTIGSASSTSAITIASTGIVTFVDDIIIKDAGTIGSASDTDSMAIASTGIVTFSQIPALPVNSIEISTTTRGSFLVIEAGGTDGAGANAGDNIIDETDSDDIIFESATDLVGSVFNVIDSAGMVVRTINSV